MTKINLGIILVSILLIGSLNGHRILGLFPHPGISHFQFFHPIMKALAHAGHDVTVVSHFPNKIPIENYRDEPLTGKSELLNFVDLDVGIKKEGFKSQNDMILKFYSSNK